MDDRALILERESPEPDAEAARLLAEHCALHPGEARTVVRASGGILVGRGERERLEELRSELARRGVLTRLVACDELYDVPRGKRAVAASVEGEQLVLRLGGGRELRLWTLDVVAIDVFVVPTRPASRPTEEPSSAWERASARRLETVVGLLPPDLSGRARCFAEAAATLDGGAPELRITLFAREPFGAIRLSKDDIDYSTLGDAKTPHSLENFLLLTDHLLATMPHLWNRAPWEELLASLDAPSTAEPVRLRGVLRQTEEEVARFERWMLHWIRSEESDLDRDLAEIDAPTDDQPTSDGSEDGKEPRP